MERHNRFAKEGKFSFYLKMNRYLDVGVCFLYLPTNILFANSNGPNNQRFADMLSVEVTSMMNGYRWDPAKHEFLIILQISSGHTNLYISDLGVIVQFSKNKKAYIFYKKTKITNFSWSYELVGLC